MPEVRGLSALVWAVKAGEVVGAAGSGALLVRFGLRTF